MTFTNHFDTEKASQDLNNRYNLDFAHILIKNGYKIYLFGGSLRDMVMGKEWKDADLRAWVALPPEERDLQTEKLLVEAGVHINSKSAFNPTFTVFRFVPPNSTSTLGIDFSVVSEQWLVGPDFTINGLYFDIDTGELIDMYNSISDIEHKIIRTAKEPNKQFTEEPYMIFRAVKCACQFGFNLEEKTFEAMKGLSDITTGVLDLIVNKTVPGLTEWFLSNLFTGLKYNPFLYEKLWNETGLMKVFLTYIANKFGYEIIPEKLNATVFEESKKYNYEEAISLFLSAVALTLDTENPEETFNRITALFSITEEKQYQDFLIDNVKIFYRKN